MPKLKHAVPKYRKHRASGQAVVTIQAQDFYLGPWNSEASKVEYDRIITEWIAAGRRLPTRGPDASDLTVVEIVAHFKDFAIGYYRKNGEPTGEWENIEVAIKPVCELYGRTFVRDFGPLALKAVRQKMIDARLCRNVINSRISKIKRVFRWAVSEELAPASVVTALATVAGLEAGRTAARETKPVKPVADEVVEKTLPSLPDVVADMVRLQRLSGCRPIEVCLVRPCDVDVTGDVWLYRPESHKTQHHGKERVIAIGPKGQDVLRRYLLRDKEAYCFSPADSERQRKAKLRTNRKTKVQPSQMDRSQGKPRKKPGNRYTTRSYGHAVRAGCEKAGVEHWSPNRLRHSAGTAIRKLFGFEAAQVTLGHSKPDTTERYAEKNLSLAIDVMRKTG
ncbi:MAG: site-specific integrase [Planctomycetota bacterium]|nr:site-specific integrase [Planctomycetota bacterium]